MARWYLILQQFVGAFVGAAAISFLNGDRLCWMVYSIMWVASVAAAIALEKKAIGAN